MFTTVPALKASLPVLVLSAAILASPTRAAVFSIAGASGVTGQSILSSVTFSAQASPVSALQFDLEWDPLLAIQIVPGSTIGGSGKLLYTAARSSNSLRVLIAEMNQGTVPDGEMVRVFLSATGAGTAQVR